MPRGDSVSSSAGWAVANDGVGHLVRPPHSVSPRFLKSEARFGIHFCARSPISHKNFPLSLSDLSVSGALVPRLAVYRRVRQSLMQVVLAYKNFAANRAISHIGLGVTAMNTAKSLRA